MHVTFSEKGTKNTPQTHIQKFKIFFSIIFSSNWRGTLFWTEKILNHCDFIDIVWEMKDFISLDVNWGYNFCRLLWKSSVKIIGERLSESLNGSSQITLIQIRKFSTYLYMWLQTVKSYIEVYLQQANALFEIMEIDQLDFI